MGGGAALWGGFSSFFSIWQVCILQISPFFIAFIVGTYLATPARETDARILRWIVPPCIAFGVGFNLFYSLLIASGLSFSRPLITNLGSLRIVAGTVILLASLHIFLVNRSPFLGKMHRPLPLSGLALLLGISFALIYSPCITPMLSDIMGLASQRATAQEGLVLAGFYGIGITLALCLVAVALTLLLGKNATALRHADAIKNACGVVLLALAIMNLTGLMRHYKAFVLGFVL
ncbi:MAG: cytochrome c-type bioproteinis protein [Gallionellaceae bacterium]|nr:MAG: cytochrome c-type bioproteinis protein [Gallionellaceae bacterium]